MIISGGSRSNWRFFAKHLMRVDENERVEIREIRGLGGETVMEALREIDALASGTRCKNSFYHANLNPRADEKLTPEQWDHAVDTLEQELGLDGHSRLVVAHHKEGRDHIHVIWSRINVDMMIAVTDSMNYAAHERAARTLEQTFGHAPVVGAHGSDGKRPKRRAKNWEKFRGHDSGLDPQEITREVTALWQQADSGKAFAASLAEHGYQLCKGDRRDFCLMDSAGDVHSLTRRIDGARAAEIRARMADIDRDALPSVSDVQPIAPPLAAAWEESPFEAMGPSAPPSVTEPLAQPEQAPASPLDAFAVKVQQSMRNLDGYKPRADMQPWWNRPVPAPQVLVQGRSLLEQFAQLVGKVMRAHGGEVPIGDGLSWLERRVAVLEATRNQVAGWVKGRWEELADQFRGMRAPDHDQSAPDREDHGRDR